MSNALVVHEITHLQFPPFHFPEADEGGNAWPNVAKMLALARPFYRTHVHMGSDHWVAFSLCLYQTFLKPCEDLVKTVNVVNVVKT